MSLINKSMASKSTGRTLPPRVSRLLRESGWLALVGGALYLILIFHSYDRGDPGWTHSGDYEHINNAGGHIGAWLSDFLLYLFGASAWWWVAFFLAAVSWSYRRIDVAGIFDRHSIFLSISGFLLLMIASSGLESLRFHSLNIDLPYQSGGIFGEAVNYYLSQLLGFTGATMTLLILIAIGFSQFTRLSWVRFVEKIGEIIENGILWLQEQWRSKRHQQTQEINGAYEREVIPATEKKTAIDTRSIHIELPATHIEKSERAVKEKQKSLFSGLSESTLPPLHLLDEPDKDVEVLSKDVLESTSRLIESKLKEFGVIVKVVAAYPGPVITRYEIEPAVGVKGNQIINLIKDLARALSVVRIRVVETIPGKTTMGLEIPNPNRQVVRLLEILSSQPYADTTSPLTIALGKDISGRPIVSDLAKMPHALVAGTTGSGKSVAINAIILSLVYKSTPDQVRLILVDPKMLELSVYEGIPHLLTPVVTDMGEAANALRWSVAEMERRYKLMSSLGVRNLNGYNHKIHEAEKKEEPIMNPLASEEAPEQLEELPLIVVVIDELADLMMVSGKKVEHLIARLAQKARAAGIHLLLATQRPSVDVITGLIKANIPTRIAFQVSSKIDSRTILDQMGAETLLGQGDMLYLPPGSGYPQRVHGAYVADHEVHKVVEYLKEHGEPSYVDKILQAGEEEGAGNILEETRKQIGGEQDPLYDEAVQIVIKTRRASISLVQRNLRIGYNRAARLIEEMERAGLVSAMQSNGNREVLVPARGE
ncbi:DNA translocase FtsK 4TM domain-containing protein [Nitrosomonas sp.]|uniref:DNA translocase FtsK n=1 Tax=Nitrosomonas sp. TaxID=42353 RepID=UPI002850A830|nr:DNA translocase FtsK 4TM domain-containing protein [Nitrosomonas sp.]MDR4513303.1 DNA translocase FtsK 4TM domain-containing protein [Nitrosomonas sp.]